MSVSDFIGNIDCRRLKNYRHQQSSRESDIEGLTKLGWNIKERTLGERTTGELLKFISDLKDTLNEEIFDIEEKCDKIHKTAEKKFDEYEEEE